MLENLKTMAAEEKLPLRDLEYTYNTRLAQELGTWADAQGIEAIHDALFRAYFVDGRDLSDVEVLVAIAAETGLDADEARRVLTERTHRDAIDRDWDRARRGGLTAVPTFVAGRRGLVGAQPYGRLAGLLEEAGAVRRGKAPTGS